MAFDDGEFDPEVRCVALPVLDFSGQVIDAIGISDLVWRLSIETLQKRAHLVRAAADRLSAEFGYVSEPEPRMRAEVQFCRHSRTARSAGPGIQIQIRCLFLDSGFARFARTPE